MTTASLEVSDSIGRGYPRLLFGALMLGHLSQGLAFTAFVAALPQMAADLGKDGTFLAQMTMSLASLGVMAGALASGRILDRAGTRLTLLASLCLYGLSGAAGLVVKDPVPLLASRFALGFASACMVTVCVWGIAAEYQGNHRARALGVAAALSSASALAGNLLGGYLTQLGGWPLAFLQYPVFGVIGFLLAFKSMRQVRPARAQAQEMREPFFRRLLPFYLLATVLLAVMFMGSTQFPFVLQQDGIANPVTRSLVLGTMTAVASAASFLYGPIERRLGPLGAITFGLISMAAALAAIGWGTSPAWAVLGSVLMGIYVGMVGPYVYHVVTERTGAVVRSHAIGTLNAFFFLGGFLNPLLFAPLSTLIGLRHVFLLIALIMAAFAGGTFTKALRAARPARGTATG